MTVANILRQKGTSVVTAKPGQKLHELMKLMTRHRIGAVIIVNANGEVAGVLSERDVVRALAGHGPDAFDHPVSRYMTEDVTTCTLDDSIEEIMEIMTRGRFRHVPVMEGGELRGIVSIGDVVKIKIEQTEREVVSLREYISFG